ncbi:MAG TPA: peptide-methionine (S)-S-oxide reductase MsrA [Candidatus Paceibacterota bacterium]|nr:peptide-methionine (S)-S-oxide reductase MsrA [Candidatus Paceibacterota bacterium]
MDTETVVFGNGCFWCTEAVFQMIKGVVSVSPGYSGGRVANPTYEQVSSGATGHAEVIKIVYNPDIVSFEEILQIFFTTHDPTSLNRQGSDVGTQYRSVIFYANERQKEKAEHYIKVLSKAYTKPIVTAVEPLQAFYPAEDYHKKYYEYHKDAPYCQLVIAPKVDKVEEKFKNLLKDAA